MKTSHQPKASDFVDYAVAGGGGSGFCPGLGAGLSARAASFYGDLTVTATADGTRQQQQHPLRQPATSTSSAAATPPSSLTAAAAASKRKRQTGEFLTYWGNTSGLKSLKEVSKRKQRKKKCPVLDQINICAYY